MGRCGRSDPLDFFCPHTDFIAEKEARAEMGAIDHWAWMMNRYVKEAYYLKSNVSCELGDCMYWEDGWKAEHDEVVARKRKELSALVDLGSAFERQFVCRWGEAVAIDKGIPEALGQLISHERCADAMRPVPRLSW